MCKDVAAAFRDSKVLLPDSMVLLPSMLLMAICGQLQAQMRTAPIPETNPAVLQIITLKGGAGYVLPTAAAAFAIPPNITLRVELGAYIDIAGKTLTMNGAIEAGMYEVFRGAGTVKVPPTNVKIREVYPQWFGSIAGDGVDDTESMNRAFQTCAKSIFIPAGNYTIQPTTRRPVLALGEPVPGALRPCSNQTVTLSKGAVLQSRPFADGDDPSAATIGVFSVRNVTIQGGRLIGNWKPGGAARPDTIGGQHGIHVGSAQNITVQRMKIEGFYGDGWTVSYIGNLASAPTLDNSKNITFRSVVSTGNYRNAASGVGWVGGSVIGGKYANTMGAASPLAGIDLEPNVLKVSYLAHGTTTAKVSDISIIDVEVSGNGGYGIQLENQETKRISISGGTIRNNRSGGVAAVSTLPSAGLTVSSTAFSGNGGPDISGNIAGQGNSHR
jgi:hypothetical protein